MVIVFFFHYYYILHIVLWGCVGVLCVRECVVQLTKKNISLGFQLDTGWSGIDVCGFRFGGLALSYQEIRLEQNMELAQKYSFRGLWDLHRGKVDGEDSSESVM